jgi:hypothetical protein
MQDEYTTLIEWTTGSSDFSTSVDLGYMYEGMKLPPCGHHEDQGPSVLDVWEETRVQPWRWEHQR